MKCECKINFRNCNFYLVFHFSLSLYLSIYSFNNFPSFYLLSLSLSISSFIFAFCFLQTIGKSAMHLNLCRSVWKSDFKNVKFCFKKLHQNFAGSGFIFAHKMHLESSFKRGDNNLWKLHLMDESFLLFL
jgi:hypothetical protein